MALDLPAQKTAYRVKQADSMCDKIGFVIQAESIEDIAATVANHGGTHFRVISDNGTPTVETDTIGSQAFGVVHAHSTSRVVQNHVYIAEAYRCS